MIWQAADGQWYVELPLHNGQPCRWGGYPSWADAFAVRRRLDIQLHAEHAAEHARKRAAAPAVQPRLGGL